MEASKEKIVLLSGAPVNRDIIQEMNVNVLPITESVSNTVVRFVLNRKNLCFFGASARATRTTLFCAVKCE